MKIQKPVAQLITNNPKRTWSEGDPYWICIMSNGRCMTGGTDGIVRYFMDLSGVMQGTDNTVENYDLSDIEPDIIQFGLEAAGGGKLDI